MTIDSRKIRLRKTWPRLPSGVKVIDYLHLTGLPSLGCKSEWAGKPGRSRSMPRVPPRRKATANSGKVLTKAGNLAGSTKASKR